MVELLVIGVLGGVLLAAFLWVVIYRAVGNLFDWVILTFGNPDAVKEVKRRRGWDSDEG